MKREEVLAAWAPEGEPWRAWVKPVLFAALAPDVAPEPPSSARDLVREAALDRRLLEPLVGKREAHADDGHPYRREPARDTAIVVELPGAKSVELGVALAPHGFRPVPLYNAQPTPPDTLGMVDLTGVMQALVDAAPSLRGLALGLPPCFLLDSNRLAVGKSLWAGVFDNRSECSPEDFPSAETLYSAGIRRFVVIRKRAAGDLEAVLATWKNRGIAGFAPASVSGQSLRRIHVRAPSWASRMLAQIRHPPLSPRGDGSFGKFIPTQRRR